MPLTIVEVSEITTPAAIAIDTASLAGMLSYKTKKHGSMAKGPPVPS